MQNELRKKRETLGLTLQEVADEIKVDITTVSSWELDRRHPKPKNRIKLAKVLKCEVNELFNRLDKEEIEPIKNQEEDNYPPSPFAKFKGELELGNNDVDCYVLDTSERVISLRAVVKAIANRERSGLADYIEVLPLKPYINSKLVLAETIEFNIPGTQYKGKGITAENFLDICNAYVSALSDNVLNTSRQKEIAIKCSILLSSCAKVGLIALIDEATGYQYARSENALQLKMKLFIADEMREWEKVFPDELWEQFGRLTNWKGSLHSRPKWWGKLVMELIYNAMDTEVTKYLKENKPPPIYKRNYHQWLSSHYGLKKLISHIFEIIGMAKTCKNMKELKDKVNHYYKGKPMQLSLFDVK